MGTRIFVGNLSYGSSESSLKEHFEQQGLEVRNVRIISDRETGRSRGFGFVEFGDASHVARAIAELDGVECDGRPLAIREAHDRKPSGGGGPRGDRRPNGRGGPPGSGPVVERVGNDGRRPRSGPPPASARPPRSRDGRPGGPAPRDAGGMPPMGDFGATGGGPPLPPPWEQSEKPDGARRSRKFDGSDRRGKKKKKGRGGKPRFDDDDFDFGDDW